MSPCTNLLPVASSLAEWSGTWKEPDWKIGDKEIWERDVWIELSEYPENVKIFGSRIECLLKEELGSGEF